MARYTVAPLDLISDPAKSQRFWNVVDQTGTVVTITGDPSRKLPHGWRLVPMLMRGLPTPPPGATYTIPNIPEIPQFITGMGDSLF